MEQKFMDYMLGEKKIITMSGPSGTGKTTSALALKKMAGYEIATQITTRAPRPDDTYYRYMSNEEFIRLKEKGKVFGYFDGDIDTGKGYGYYKEEVLEELNDHGKIILFPSPFEMKDPKSFREIYGTVNKVGLGFRDAQSVVRRALVCGKKLSPEELASRVNISKVLTYIMEKYNRTGDETFSLIYSDATDDYTGNIRSQLEAIARRAGLDPKDFEKEINDFIPSGR